eukprot:Selendium_serpulae@DN5394_c0_g1_i1.p2
MIPQVVGLAPFVQPYPWGKLGTDSSVARLCQKSRFGAVTKCKSDEIQNCQFQENKPYAELWLGDHTNGPTMVRSGELGGDVTIAEFLKDNMAESASSSRLPFLLKVLSVRTALSIQVHPDAETAAKLHQTQPDKYTDPNHKPEMAIAVTDFEVLCGFRETAKIVHDLEKLPCCRSFFGEISRDNVSQQTAIDLLEQVLKASKEKATELVKSTTAYLSSHSESDNDRLFCRLEVMYPNDVGCFAAYFLNHVMLSPGKALYIPANIPHAYISGDCIEIMAPSDNVVRAGLTPKFIDTELLISLLRQRKEEWSFVTAQTTRECLSTYQCSAQEFQMHRITLRPGESCDITKSGKGIIIGIVLTGSLKFGDATFNEGECFLSRNASGAMQLRNTHSNEEMKEMKVFLASHSSVRLE